MIVPSPGPVRKARIEIIPLIDVMFFLLATFIMVSLSMIQNKGITVNLPAATSALPQDREKPVTIGITAGGEIYFNRDKVDAGTLRQDLLRLKSAEPRVFIEGDRDASLGAFTAVMDLVRQTGITKIAILTANTR